jgi:hypothetical protein
MAKVKFSALIQDIRGSFGNGVFSNLRGQAYLRRKSKTVANPQTASQKSVRDILTSLSRQWYQVLDATQRASWSELAAIRSTAAKAEKQTGTKGLMKSSKAVESGINCFIGVNAILATQGQGPLLTAPLGADAPSAPTGLAAVYSASPAPHITLEWTDPADLAANGNIFVWAKSSHFFKASRLQTAVSKAEETAEITQMKGKGGVLLDICPDNYFFQVQAQNPTGLKSPGSAIVSVNVPTA